MGAPPVADKVTRASGSGRRGTRVLRHRGHSPGTATGSGGGRIVAKHLAGTIILQITLLADKYRFRECCNGFCNTPDYFL